MVLTVAFVAEKILSRGMLTTEGVRYAKRERPDGHAVFGSGNQSRFWYKAILPLPYPIPSNGPAGKLLKKPLKKPKLTLVLVETYPSCSAYPIYHHVSTSYRLVIVFL